MNLDLNFALAVLAVMAVTAMALTLGKPSNLDRLGKILEGLLKAIERFLW